MIVLFPITWEGHSACTEKKKRKKNCTVHRVHIDNDFRIGSNSNIYRCLQMETRNKLSKLFFVYIVS